MNWYSNASRTRIVLRGLAAIFLGAVIMLFANFPPATWVVVVTVPTVLTLVNLFAVRKVPSDPPRSHDA